jgi:hypothetical protein
VKLAGELVERRKKDRDIEGGMLQSIDGKTTNYLYGLKFPEIAHDIRMDSEYPILSATYHRHFTCQLQTNASGNGALLFNPFFQQDVNNTLSGLQWDNVAGVNLTTPEATTGYTAISMNSVRVPVSTYSSYRLVSCSLKMLANASLTTATGIFGLGVANLLYVPNSISGVGSTNVLQAGAYTVQANVDQTLYFKQANVARQEEIRAIYYPLDPTFEMFVGTNYTRSNLLATEETDFYFVGYASALPASSFITLEIDLNFECTINPLAQGYIPVGIAVSNCRPGPASKVISQTPDSVTQAGSNLNTFVEQEEESFWDVAKSTASTLGKNVLKWLPSLLI